MRRETELQVKGALGTVAGLTLMHALLVQSVQGLPASLQMVHEVMGTVATVVALLGTLAAAGAFKKGDHLRGAWVGLSVSSALYVLGTLVRVHWLVVAPGRPLLESPLLSVRMAVVVLANVAWTWALVQLVLTYHRSGVHVPWRKGEVLLAVLGLAGAVLFCLPSFRHGLEGLALSGPRFHMAVIEVTSTLADLAQFALLVPLLRNAWLMRGGRLSWVWWTMAASTLVWLVYDVREWLAVVLPGDPEQNLQLLLVTRTCAFLVQGLTGWLQFEALTMPVTGRAPPSPARP